MPLFHGNNGHVNAPRCYAIRNLTLLFYAQINLQTQHNSYVRLFIKTSITSPIYFNHQVVILRGNVSANIPCAITYLLTYSMVQSPSWAADWLAASQEIPRISRNPKVHYRTHKRPPPVPILGQPDPVLTCINYFNIIYVALFLDRFLKEKLNHLHLLHDHTAFSPP